MKYLYSILFPNPMTKRNSVYNFVCPGQQINSFTLKLVGTPRSAAASELIRLEGIRRIGWADEVCLA